MTSSALTGVDQLIGCHPAKQKSPVRFPVRAHVWVAGLVLVGWGVYERQPNDVSLPLFLPPFPPF